MEQSFYVAMVINCCVVFYVFVMIVFTVICVKYPCINYTVTRWSIKRMVVYISWFSVNEISPCEVSWPLPGPQGVKATWRHERLRTVYV